MNNSKKRKIMETKQDSAIIEKETGYECSMHCEKDKIYGKPGNCTVCNMKLMPVGEKGSSGNHCSCC